MRKTPTPRSIWKTENSATGLFELPNIIGQLAKLLVICNPMASTDFDKQMVESVGVAVGRVFKPLFGFHCSIGANGVSHFTKSPAFNQVVGIVGTAV